MPLKKDLLERSIKTLTFLFEVLDRETHVRSALYGSKVLPLVKWGGSNVTFVTTLVYDLAGHGGENGKHYLEYVLEQVQSNYPPSNEHYQTLQSLLEEIRSSMSQPTPPIIPGSNTSTPTSSSSTVPSTPLSQTSPNPTSSSTSAISGGTVPSGGSSSTSQVTPTPTNPTPPPPAAPGGTVPSGGSSSTSQGLPPPLGSRLQTVLQSCAAISAILALCSLLALIALRPYTEFTYAFDATETFQVNFAARATGGTINRYTWDFGDGNGAEGSQTSHGFKPMQEYPVSLTVCMWTTDFLCQLLPGFFSSTYEKNILVPQDAVQLVSSAESLALYMNEAKSYDLSSVIFSEGGETFALKIYLEEMFFRVPFKGPDCIAFSTSQGESPCRDPFKPDRVFWWNAGQPAAFEVTTSMGTYRCEAEHSVCVILVETE